MANQLYLLQFIYRKLNAMADYHSSCMQLLLCCVRVSHLGKLHCWDISLICEADQFFCFPALNKYYIPDIHTRLFEWTVGSKNICLRVKPAYSVSACWETFLFCVRERERERERERPRAFASLSTPTELLTCCYLAIAPPFSASAVYLLVKNMQSISRLRTHLSI